jgi:hypothetical protein
VIGKGDTVLLRSLILLVATLLCAASASSPPPAPRPAAATEPSDRQEIAGQRMAMVLLRQAIAPDHDAVLAALTSAGHAPADHTVTAGGLVHVYRYRHGHLLFNLVNVPSSDPSNKVVDTALLWPEVQASGRLPAHAAYLQLRFVPTDGRPHAFEDAWLLTQLAQATLASSSEALGVIWESGAMADLAHWKSNMAEASPARPPLLLWVGVAGGTGGAGPGRLFCKTWGMQHFGLREVLVTAPENQVKPAYEFLWGVATMALERRVDLGDGSESTASDGSFTVKAQHLDHPDEPGLRFVRYDLP